MIEIFFVQTIHRFVGMIADILRTVLCGSKSIQEATNLYGKDNGEV